MKSYSFTACQAPRCSCPVIEVEDGMVYISDDYQHVAQMTVDEFALIVKDFIHRYDLVTNVQQGPL